MKAYEAVAYSSLFIRCSSKSSSCQPETVLYEISFLSVVQSASSHWKMYLQSRSTVTVWRLSADLIPLGSAHLLYAQTKRLGSDNGK